jgi:hypothetical protein
VIGPEVGTQTQIANPQICELIPLSQIRKFFRCASLHIANMQSFMQIAKIREFLQNAVSKVLEVVFENDFLFMYKFELKHYMSYL